ncbi:hypothetical protein V8C34DRAFT_221897 [Trichoderma compactum]
MGMVSHKGSNSGAPITGLGNFRNAETVYPGACGRFWAERCNAMRSDARASSNQVRVLAQAVTHHTWVHGGAESVLRHVICGFTNRWPGFGSRSLFCILFPSSNTKQQGSCYLFTSAQYNRRMDQRRACYRTHAHFQPFQTDHPAHLAPYVLYILPRISGRSEVAATMYVRKRKSGGDIPPLISHNGSMYGGYTLFAAIITWSFLLTILSCPAMGRCQRFERVSGESPDFARRSARWAELCPRTGRDFFDLIHAPVKEKKAQNAVIGRQILNCLVSNCHVRRHDKAAARLIGVVEAKLRLASMVVVDCLVTFTTKR